LDIAPWTLGRPNPTNVPIVAITLPARNAVFTDPTYITNHASVTPAGAAISFVDYYLDGQWLDQASTSPYEVLSSPSPGVHTLRAAATDENNQRGVSAPIIFTVRNSSSTITAQDDFYHILVNSAATNLNVL